MKLGGGGEAHRDELTGFGKDLVGLCLRDTFDEEKILFGREGDTLNSIVACFC